MKAELVIEAYEIMKRIEDYYQKMMTLQEHPVVDIFAYTSVEDKENYTHFEIDLEERLFMVEGYRAAIAKLKEELKSRGVVDG